MDKQTINKIAEKHMQMIRAITCTESLSTCQTCQDRVADEIEEVIEEVIKLMKEAKE